MIKFILNALECVLALVLGALLGAWGIEEIKSLPLGPEAQNVIGWVVIGAVLLLLGVLIPLHFTLKVLIQDYEET